MQIFSKDAFPAAQKYFRYLHFTSEAEVRMDGTAIKLKPGTASKRVLRFSLGMPPADKVRQVSVYDVLGHGAARERVSDVPMRDALEMEGYSKNV